jgi:hypothetical protein
MTNPTETNIPAEHRPGAEWVLKDIDRSIEYRKKYYEYSVTIATALLAFSISFPPTLTAVHCVALVRVAWGGTWRLHSVWCDGSFCMVEILHFVQ